MLVLHPLQPVGDAAHAALEERRLLVAEGRVELRHLHEEGMQVLPSPEHDLLHEPAQVVDEPIVLRPGLHKLRLVPLEPVHAVVADHLPLRHGLVYRAVHVLDLARVVIEVDAQRLGLLEVAGYARAQDALPLGGVVEDVLGVLGVVQLVLLGQLQVYRGVGGGTVRAIPPPPAADDDEVRRGGRGRGVVPPPRRGRPPVGRTDGIGGYVPRTPEEGGVHREGVDRLGHLQSRFAVRDHRRVVVRKRRYQELEVLAELLILGPQFDQVLVAILRLGDAGGVLDAGDYPILLHHLWIFPP